MKPVQLYDPVFMTLAIYASHVHDLNRLWWYTEDGKRLFRSHPEMLALVVSELAEALEGDRKLLMDDHLPQYPMPCVELADTVIRLLDWSGTLCLDLRSYDIDFVEPGVRVSEHLFALMKRVTGLIDTKFDELPQEVSYIIDTCQALSERIAKQHPFWEIVQAKLVYNQSRADHQYEARKAEGGKSY